jgi:hypothetical protein
MKYITYIDYMTTLPAFVIFPSIIKHDDMAKGLRFEQLLGAGFWSKDPYGKYVCHGESTSLKLKSRNEEDTELVYQYLKDR